MVIVLLMFLLLKVWMCFESCSHTYNLFLPPKPSLPLRPPATRSAHRISYVCLHYTAFFISAEIPPLDCVCGGVLESMFMFRTSEPQSDERFVQMFLFFWVFFLTLNLSGNILFQSGCFGFYWENIRGHVITPAILYLYKRMLKKRVYGQWRVSSR